jgi:hypothetical protein
MCGWTSDWYCDNRVQRLDIFHLKICVVAGLCQESRRPDNAASQCGLGAATLQFILANAFNAYKLGGEN